MEPEVEHEEIQLDDVRRKDGARLTTGEVNSHDADQSSFNISEKTILTGQRNFQSDGNRELRDKKAGGKYDETPEKPKEVWTRELWIPIFNFVTLHAIPLGVAITLIVLNIKTYFYGANGTWVPALQFVAKAHEMLMQISIVAVMVAYLQYLLTHKHPIPFGAIFSAYQVTQMSYLVSPEFRAALTTADWPALVKIPFLIFVSFSILLASAVGPSSAIAMQPRLVNYTVPDANIALNVTSEVLYPNSFDSAGLPLYYNTETNMEPRTELSPADGWDYLAYLPPLEDSETGQQSAYVPNNQADGGTKNNLRMPDVYSTEIATYTPWVGENGRGTEVARTVYVQYAPNSTFVTVQHVPVALSLVTASDKFAERLPGDRNGVAIASIEMPQAYASVFCQLNSIKDENDTLPIQFPDTYLAPCKTEYGCVGTDENALNGAGTTDYDGITKQEILSQAKKSPQGRIIWVDDIKISTPVSGRALGAIVIQPDFCGANYTYLTTSACVVGAHWAKTWSFIQTVPDVLDGSKNTAQNYLSPQDPIMLPLWSSPPIHLSKIWAESLNPVTNIRNRTVADALLRALPMNGNICPMDGTYEQDEHYSNSQSRPFLHERLIASLVANGMSHAAGVTEIWVDWPILGFDKPTHGKWELILANAWNLQQLSRPNPPGLVMKFHGGLPGYAWNMHAIPIKVALPILCLYCLYILLYVAYSFITRNSSSCWGKISGLTALAMNSRPTSVLENTSAGIEEIGTFRRLVGVREVVDDGKLELVFRKDEVGDERGLTRRVGRGKAYR